MGVNFRNTVFYGIASDIKACPPQNMPEIVFSGKSNVGKSSLVNALSDNKRLARVSQTPGKTQAVVYFNVDKKFYIADLPGYGYARVSQTTRKKWGDMIERYLKKSPSLKAVFLLIDIRHEPGANDKQMYDWIVANGFRPVIIATKSDKISRGQIKRQTSMILKSLGCPPDTLILPFSALSRSGREEIWAEIEKMIEVK